MFSLLSLLLLLLSCAQPHGVLSLPQSNDVHETKYFTRTIQKKNARNLVFESNIGGLGLPYFNDLHVNDPCRHGKMGRLLVDTGSSDFWIDGKFWCSCEAAEVFDTNEQLCGQIIDLTLDGVEVRVEYGDGGWAQGPLITHRFKWADKMLQDGKFIAATSRSDDQVAGVIGLGYLENQSTRKPSTFSSLPWLLLYNDYTKSVTYSMWFSNPADANGDEPAEHLNGQVMFGGYISNYFDDELSSYDIQSTKEITIKWSDMWYSHSPLFDSISLFDNCQTWYKVLLDTGSFKSRLPREVFDALGQEIGMTKEITELKTGLVPCANVDHSAKIAFQFGQKSIWVPIQSFVRPITRYESSKYGIDENECIIHGFNWIDPSEKLSYEALLGDTFLQYAYVLYDLEDRKIGLAQTSYREGIQPKYIAFDDHYKKKLQAGYPTPDGPQMCFAPPPVPQ